MKNTSTQLDPTLRSAELHEFDVALRSRVVGREEAHQTDSSLAVASNGKASALTGRRIARNL
jgi:hypothetical protein